MAILKDFVLAIFCLQIEIKTINIKTIAILFSRQGRILHNGNPGIGKYQKASTSLCLHLLVIKLS